MKHLLLVCYFYPPDGGAGTQRPLSIAKHAASCGWRVTVLTRDMEHERSAWDPTDRSLHQTFSHVKECRVKVPSGSNASQMMAVLDGASDPWLVALSSEANQIHQVDPIDHVLITMPPYGMAPLAKMIKQSCPPISVSIDLRDPWAFDGAYSYPSKSAWRSNLKAMRQTAEIVDGIIVNTPEVAKRMRTEFGNIPSNRIEVVTNGFESDLFDTELPTRPEGYEENRFHLVHVGTLHSRAVLRSRGIVGFLRRLKNYRAEDLQMEGRTAVPILRAISKLNQQNHPDIDRLKLVLVGRDDPATRQIAKESGCANQIMMTGYLGHDKAVAWLRWAQCLFLPLHGLPDGERSLIVPGKTYEYLACQQPILGALPEGDARDFLQQSKRAYLSHPCDSQQLAEQLSKALLDYRNANFPKGEPHEWVMQFSRLSLTRRLFDFLEQITPKGSG